MKDMLRYPNERNDPNADKRFQNQFPGDDDPSVFFALLKTDDLRRLALVTSFQYFKRIYDSTPLK